MAHISQFRRPSNEAVNLVEQKRPSQNSFYGAEVQYRIHKDVPPGVIMIVSGSMKLREIPEEEVDESILKLLDPRHEIFFNPGSSFIPDGAEDLSDQELFGQIIYSDV